MDARDLVTRHYSADDLTGRILAALADSGVEVDRLGPAQLFVVDQLHLGGAPAAHHLLDRLEVGPGVRLLDVGCGIGGPSRMAAMAGAEVTGVDLTPDFVETATALTELTGLAHAAHFLTTPAESLPFDDDTFEAAMMVHVGMNVPDKAALFAEVGRVLAPGGRFAVYDQVRTGAGALTYPLPWAGDDRSSFVETTEDYVAALEACGFAVVEVEDRTPFTTEPPPGVGVTNSVTFGPDFVERLDNLLTDTRSGVLGSRLILARR